MADLRHWLLLAAIALVFSSGAGARNDSPYSLPMPLAGRSLLLDIAIVADKAVSVGERGHVLISEPTSGGWAQGEVPTRQLLTSVYFLDERSGWAAGHDGIILATHDGGKHWSIQRDGLASQARENQEQRQRLLERLEALEARIAAEESAQVRADLLNVLDELQLDLEDIDYALSAPAQAPPLMDVWIADADRGYAVGAFGTLLITRDGGRHWQSIGTAIDNPGDMHFYGVTGDGEGNVWVVGEGGVLYHSVDAGETWQSLEAPYRGTFFGIARAPGTGRLVVFGLRGNAFFSDDLGKTWLPSLTNTQRSIAGGVWLNDQYIILAGAVGGLLVSEDAGKTFEPRPLPNRLDLSAVAVRRGKVIAVGQGGIHSIGTLQ